MARFDYDIGVIGCGSAGLSVASAAAQLGLKTLMIEKEDRLGGDCLHFGCVPSKTLIHTARAAHLARRMPELGLPPARLGEVDFSQVRARIEAVIARIQRHDSIERFTTLGADVRLGQPRFTDDHAVQLGGGGVSAARWVIATGSSPAMPPIPGLEKTGALTNREIFYLDRLPSSLLILGGGPIGVEMGQAFARLGSRVTIVERARHLLVREDEDMAGPLQARLAEEGVGLELGASVTRVWSEGGMKKALVTTQEGGERTLAAEEILAALGRRPNLEGLGLANAGVERGPRGLILDKRLRTTRPHIYGAGDVTGSFQFTHAAGYEASVIVANAVFHLPKKVDYTNLPWCTYADPELASIGHNEQSAREAGLEYELAGHEFAMNDRALAEAHGLGKIKVLVGRRGRPLGVQILGPSAGDILAEWTTALSAGVKMSHLAGVVHPYPTLGEINKQAAAGFMGAKLFSPRVRRLLRLVFGYRG